MHGVKKEKKIFGYKLSFPSILAGEVLVFYLPICFFYNLAKFDNILFLKSISRAFVKRKKLYPFICVFRDMIF